MSVRCLRMSWNKVREGNVMLGDVMGFGEDSGVGRATRHHNRP